MQQAPQNVVGRSVGIAVAGVVTLCLIGVGIWMCVRFSARSKLHMDPNTFAGISGVPPPYTGGNVYGGGSPQGPAGISQPGAYHVAMVGYPHPPGAQGYLTTQGGNAYTPYAAGGNYMNVQQPSRYPTSSQQIPPQSYFKSPHSNAPQAPQQLQPPPLQPHIAVQQPPTSYQH
eukprot:jgi/Chrzof1/6454/Cz18g11150.t1